MNPPFSMIGRVLDKIRDDNANVVMIAPHWVHQPWWPQCVAMAGGSWALPYGPSFQLEGVGDPLPPRAWRVMAFRFYQRPSTPAITATLPRMVGPLRIHDMAPEETTARSTAAAQSVPSQPCTPMDRDEIGTPFFSRSPSAYADTDMALPSSLPDKRLNDNSESATHTLNKRSRA